MSQRDLARNRRAVQSYEGSAVEYSAIVAKSPWPHDETALRRLLAVVPPGGEILEVGSGPGRDADFVESLGVRVRRTDVTEAFLALQRERGKDAHRLDLLTDDLGGPYDGILALCVLIHIDRDATDAVLEKIAAALREGGAFLVSLREGAGETDDGCPITFWSRDEFAARLAAAGLSVAWEQTRPGGGGEPWLTFLARKP